MELTDYEKSIWDRLSQVDDKGNLLIKFDVNYAIDPVKLGDKYLEFIEAIKKHIDTWGNFEFGADYKNFRRIIPPKYIECHSEAKKRVLDQITIMHKNQIIEMKKQFPKFKKWNEVGELAESSQYGNTRSTKPVD